MSSDLVDCLEVRPVGSYSAVEIRAIPFGRLRDLFLIDRASRVIAHGLDP